MKKIIKLVFCSVLLCQSFLINAQEGVAINTTGNPPADASALHVNIANKGVLIPNVALTNTAIFEPVKSIPVSSLLINK